VFVIAFLTYFAVLNSSLKNYLTFCMIYKQFDEKNNHNARITNFEKEHYKQGRVNLEDD